MISVVLSRTDWLIIAQALRCEHLEWKTQGQESEDATLEAHAVRVVLKKIGWALRQKLAHTVMVSLERDDCRTVRKNLLYAYADIKLGGDKAQMLMDVSRRFDKASHK
jgi:hypothetical protein